MKSDCFQWICSQIMSTNELQSERFQCNPNFCQIVFGMYTVTGDTEGDVVRKLRGFQSKGNRVAILLAYKISYLNNALIVDDH